MLSKEHYKTKQMTAMLDFFKSSAESHVTVNDIYKHLTNKGISLGVTTIYRNLERLVQQGLVAKYVIEGRNSACFEYIGDRSNSEESNCFHCKCEKCGKLIHINCDEVLNFKQHMLEHHDFELNPFRTVFYGLCSDCRS